MSFSQFLRNYRAKAGISQATLAKLIGASLGVVKAWEQGRRIPSKFTILGIKSML